MRYDQWADPGKWKCGSIAGSSVELMFQLWLVEDGGRMQQSIGGALRPCNVNCDCERSKPNKRDKVFARCQCTPTLLRLLRRSSIVSKNGLG